MHKVEPWTHLTIKSDCKTTVAVVNKGSSKMSLNMLGMKMRRLAASKMCSLSCLYLPGSDNSVVDMLSRRVPRGNEQTMPWSC